MAFNPVRSLQTRATLVADLTTLGLRPGMAALVHSSLSRIGYVVGGAQAVILALMDVLGPDGTLMTPTFSGDLTDPATWVAPSVPEVWHDAIRANVLPYDPRTTPTRLMGRIPETFRTWPGVHRSSHPVLSFAAWGRHASDLVADQPLDWGFGEGSPLARFYDLDGSVLLIGVGHARNSSLHLAESRAPHRRIKTFRLPVERDGVLAWEDHQEVGDDGGRLFPLVGTAFEATGGAVLGSVGSAEARLMPQRALVDFATAFLERTLVELQQRE